MKKKILVWVLIAAFVLSAAAGGFVLLIRKNASNRIAPTDTFVYRFTGELPDTTLVTVDGNALPLDLYLYWLAYSCAYYEDYFRGTLGTGMDWDAELQAGVPVRHGVVNDALQMYELGAVVENMAKEAGISLTKEQEQQLQKDRAKKVIDLDGEEQFAAFLDASCLTEESYLRMNREDLLYSALYTYHTEQNTEHRYSDDQMAALAADYGFITADHILFASYDLVTGNDLTAEELAAKQAAAEAVLAELKSTPAEDLPAAFDRLAAEYSDDKGRMKNPNGYTFTAGQMDPSFEEAAYRLQEGELSGLVESSFGIHIIYRRPLDREAAIGTISDNYMDVLQDLELKNAEIKVNEELLGSIDPEAFYTAYCSYGADGSF